MNKEVLIYGSWLGRVVAAGPEQSVVRIINGPLAGMDHCFCAGDLQPVTPDTVPTSDKGEATMSEFNTKTISELVAEYNEMVLTALDLGFTKFKMVKSFHDKEAGVKRCEAIHNAIQENLASDKSKGDDKKESGKKEKVNKEKVKKELDKPQRQSSILDTAKINILVGENPKRGKAKERFAMYRDGMLVSTYKEKVGDPAQALACLRWDVKHKFIKIT